MSKAKIVTLAFLLSSTPAWGLNYKLIDAHGNTVIPPLYDSIDEDGKGHLVLTGANGSVTADFNGRKVSEVAEKDSKPLLPEGIAVYYDRDGYLFAHGPGGCGVFSSSGKELIPATYDNLTYHGEHIFSATKYENLERKTYLLNDTGKVITVLPSWARPESRRFGNGLLNVSDFEVRRFVDTTGHIKVIGGDKYHEIGDFNDGLSVANYRDLNSWYSGYIDTSGNMVIGPFKEFVCSPFSLGIARIDRIKNDTTLGACGLVKPSGEFALPIGIYDALSVAGDKHWLGAKSNSLHLLRYDGSEICKLPAGCVQISAPSEFSATSWIPCQISVSDGKASSKELLWGYCDISGKLRIAPKYSSCVPFHGDAAEASLSLDGKNYWGVIDRQGKWILQPSFMSIRAVAPDRFIVPVESADGGKKQFAQSSRADRWKIFCRFLRDFELIGMSRTELESNLGKPTSEGAPGTDEAHLIWYSLTPNVMCGNAAMSLEFRLDDNKNVNGWRVTELMSPRNRGYITENVRQERLYGPLTVGNLVPKEN